MSVQVGILEVSLINQQRTDANHCSFFDRHAPVTVAATCIGFNSRSADKVGRSSAIYADCVRANPLNNLDWLRSYP